MAAKCLNETQFLNLWAETGAQELVINSHVQEQLQSLKLALVDLSYALQTGQVVKSDMIENRGLWEIHGNTLDDDFLIIVVAVRSAECEVELLRISVKGK